MARTMHKGLFLAGALVALCTVVVAAWMLRDGLARPRSLKRVTVEVEPASFADWFPGYSEVIARRLDAADATEVSIERQGTNEVVIQYRPPADSSLAARLADRIAQKGELAFLVQAEASDVARLGSTLEGERARLDAWLDQHPEGPLWGFRLLDRARGGPVAGLRWCARRGAGTVEGLRARCVPFLEPAGEWRFGAADVGELGLGVDRLGLPALDFEMKPERARAFGDFTASIVDRQMGIVLDDEILTLATVNDRLMGSSQISGGRGGFSAAEVQGLIFLLRQGELPLRPLRTAHEQILTGWSLRAHLGLAGIVAAGLTALTCLLALARHGRSTRNSGTEAAESPLIGPETE